MIPLASGWVAILIDPSQIHEFSTKRLGFYESFPPMTIGGLEVRGSISFMETNAAFNKRLQGDTSAVSVDLSRKNEPQRCAKCGSFLNGRKVEDGGRVFCSVKCADEALVEVRG